MVELQLQPLETSLSKDTYVSIRIGDAQKLSRANQTRNFKFPANTVADRKFAKLEIFKRVGGCSLGITAKQDQELCVKLLDDSTVNFKAMFKDMGALSAPPKPATKEDTNVKVQAAKEYLDKHNLEMRLSEAMQTVLKERPEDPARFIAEKLMSSADTVKFVAKEQPKAPEVKMLPFPQYYSTHMKQMKGKAFEDIYACFPTKAASAPKKAVTSLTKYGALAATASTSELEAGLSALSQNDIARLAKMMAAPVASASTKVMTVTEMAALLASASAADTGAALASFSADVKAKLKDALASPSGPKAATKMLPFKEYYANFKEMPKGSFNDIYKNFPSNSNVSTRAPTPEAAKTLKDYIASAKTAGLADVEAALSTLTEDGRKRLQAIFKAGSASPSVAEIAALASSASTADTAATLTALSADVKKKLSDALIALSTKPATLAEITALAASASSADTEVALSLFSAGVKAKLTEALGSLA